MESNNDDSPKISTLDCSSNLADHPQKNSVGDVEKKQDDVMTPDSTVPENHSIATIEEMEDWHGRLWIQDLDCRVKSSDLWELFEPFGEVREFVYSIFLYNSFKLSKLLTILQYLTSTLCLLKINQFLLTNLIDMNQIS